MSLQPVRVGMTVRDDFGRLGKIVSVEGYVQKHFRWTSYLLIEIRWFQAQPCERGWHPLSSLRTWQKKGGGIIAGPLCEMRP
jgi:hypothetical protein